MSIIYCVQAMEAKRGGDVEAMEESNGEKIIVSLNFTQDTMCKCSRPKLVYNLIIYIHNGNSSNDTSTPQMYL